MMGKTGDRPRLFELPPRAIECYIHCVRKKSCCWLLISTVLWV